MQGREKLKIDWDLGAFTAHDSRTYDDKLRGSARKGGLKIRDRGDVDAAMKAADRVVEAEYFVPYFIYTPMEPPVAVIDATSKPVRIWASTQSPNQARQYVATALGMDPNKDLGDIECNVTLLGGGFGRKSKADFICEAAILSKKVGAPVRVQWTREDEIRYGYYHSACAQTLSAGLDKSGKVTSWKQSGA